MDENVLSAEEMKFFETGVMSPELAAAAPEPASVPDTAPSSVEPPPAPAAVDLSFLQQRLADEQARRLETEAAIEKLRADIEAAKPQPVVPDLNTDPLGHLLHKINHIEEVVNAVQNTAAQSQAQTAVERNFKAFAENVNALKNDFLKTSPDFDAAREHVINVRRADYAEQGLTQAQIDQEIVKEEIRTAESALKSGKNPAAELYAKAIRYGYKKATSVVDEGAKLAKVAAAIKANPEPATRTAVTGTDLTLEALKTASDTDITGVALDDAKWFKIVGGRSSGKGIF